MGSELIGDKAGGVGGTIGDAPVSSLEQLKKNTGDNEGGRPSAVMRIPVDVSILLGVARLQISKLMELQKGATIPLERKVGDLVDVVANGRIFARGEIVALDASGTRFGVSLKEVVGDAEGE